MIEARKIPLPVADNQLKLKIAASAVGFATTGGIRITSLSRPGTGIFGSEIPSSKAFVCGSPQTKTTTLRIIHGSQARRISDCGLRIAEFSERLASLVVGSFSKPSFSSPCLCVSVAALITSPGKRQMRFGCQSFIKRASDARENTAATTSTNHGP